MKIKTITLNWKEYSIDKKLPDTFLKKDYQWTPYLDISVVRDILRQLWILKSITFWKINKIFEWTNSSTLVQTATIELKDWIIVEGQWVLSVSNKKLISWASFWVLSNLRSRAVKTALTYIAPIFELPIEWEEEMLEEKAEEIASKIKDNEIKSPKQERDYAVELAEYLWWQEIKDAEHVKKLAWAWTKKEWATKSKVWDKVFEQIKTVVYEYVNSFNK